MKKVNTFDTISSRNRRLSEISVSSGGRNLHIPEGLIYGPFMSNFYIVEYCKKGSLTIFVDGKKFEIRAGDLYVIAPNKTIKKHYNAPITATMYLTVGGTKPGKYFKMLGFSSKSIKFPYSLTYKSLQYFEALIDCLKTNTRLSVDTPTDILSPQIITNETYTNHLGIEASLRESSLFTSLLSELFRSHGTSERSGDKSEYPVYQEYIEEALRYIEANYSYDISVDSIAKHIGITRNYLFMIFQKHLGISPQKALLQMRMSAACEFLKSGAPIKAVAASVGYDPLAFSRAFKTFIGVTPSEYKKHCKQI